MKDYKIIAISAALAMAAASGCAGSSVVRTQKLYGGAVTYEVSSNLTEYGADENNDGYHSFDVKGADCSIAVIELPGPHQTARGYADGLAETYEESDSYSDVKVSACQTKGDQSYLITARTDDNCISETYVIQFGDTTKVGIIASAPEGDKKCRKELDIILDSLEYYGEPGKTAPEQFENDLFSAEIGVDWCIYAPLDGADPSALQVGYNQFDDIDLLSAQFILAPLEDGADPARKVNILYMGACENYEGKEAYLSEPIRMQEKFLGFDAEKVEYQDGSEEKQYNRICWYFFADGRCYEAKLSCPVKYSDSFAADIQPVIDSISFK